VGFIIGFIISSIVGFAASSVIGLKCSTKGQLSFKVKEGVQSTAVKNSYLSILSQKKNIYV